MKPTHSQHIETNHSETNSLPATRPIPPTALSELLFQRPQNQGLPRLRDFVTAVFSVELERFVLSLVSTSSRLLESCSPIVLGTSFFLATTRFLLYSTLPSRMRYSPPPSSSSRALLSSQSLVFLLSLTACSVFDSLQWCLYMLALPYLLRLACLRSTR